MDDCRVSTQPGQGTAGRAPQRTGRVSARLVCLLQPRTLLAENYYRLRHVVESLQRGDAGVVIAVTSPGGDDGKTLTAINLAGALAQNPDVSVLLVDLDLRHPTAGIDRYLGLGGTNTAGISEWILDPALTDADITGYLKEFNLHIVRAGSVGASPYGLLKSPRLHEFLQEARRRHDFVIVDTTQILTLPDVQLMASLVDRFLVVVRAGHTAGGMLEEALSLLLPDKVLGLVLNDNIALR